MSNPKKRKVPEPLQAGCNSCMTGCGTRACSLGKGLKESNRVREGLIPQQHKPLATPALRSRPVLTSSSGHPLLFWVSVLALACVTAMELSGTSCLSHLEATLLPLPSSLPLLLSIGKSDQVWGEWSVPEGLVALDPLEHPDPSSLPVLMRMSHFWNQCVVLLQ